MQKKIACSLIILLVCTAFGSYLLANNSPRPLRKSELLALVAGDALPIDIVAEIELRGLEFHASNDFLSQLKTGGADGAVLKAVSKASGSADSPAGDQAPDELLQHLSKAGASIINQQYDDAIAELTTALKTSIESPECGFVIGQVLMKQERWPEAAAVYTGGRAARSQASSGENFQ